MSIIMRGRDSSDFLAAPSWKQERALAKADLLHAVEDFLQHRGVNFTSQDKAIERYLELFNSKKVGGDILDRIQRIRVSKRTFYRWRKQYQEDGVVGLLPGYKETGSRIAPDVEEKIKELIWQNPEFRFKDIEEDLLVLFSREKVPSYATIRRFSKAYREDHWPELVLEHEGRKGLRDRNMQPALGRKDANIIQPNQRWELDTTLADLFTKTKDTVLVTQDGKRCKVLGVIDVFSRMPKFFLTDRESGFAIGQAIRDRILAWGLPELIVIDNGRPYKNRRVLGFLRGLSVSVLICTPGTPEEKPFVERVFRTLSEKLLRRLQGYSGNSVKNRPREIVVSYTRAELQEIIDGWVESVYAEEIHRGTGQRPRERMNPPGFTPVTVAERDLDILLMEAAERKVRQGFIQFECAKFFHHLLPEGRWVTVRINDFDASELLVYHEGQYICTAVDFSRKGWTPQQIREAKKSRNSELRTRVKAHQALLRKTEPADALVLRRIEEAEAKRPHVLPRKADVVPFPEHRDVRYTGDVEPSETPVSPGSMSFGEAPEDSLITNDREFYLFIRRKEIAGQPLEGREQAFLEEFLDSDEYRLVGDHLDRTLKKEASGA